MGASARLVRIDHLCGMSTPDIAHTRLGVESRFSGQRPGAARGKRVARVTGGRYQMRQRLFSIGDDYWIETDTGQRVYKVDGKASRIRTTLISEDADGHEAAKIQERIVRITDAMRIEDADGHQMARVTKPLLRTFA
jgi:hypothetical protein